MRFTIATATTAHIINTLIDAGVISRTPLREITDMANFSAVIVGDDLIIDLNDEVIVKYLSLVIKLTKLINSAMALMETDIGDLVKFALTKKGN